MAVRVMSIGIILEPVCWPTVSGFTESTSASCFYLLHFLSQGRNDIKQVADNRIIGDFEDGGLGIFVHGDDGARAFHAYDVLDGAANAEREIKLGRDRLAGRA